MRTRNWILLMGGLALGAGVAALLLYSRPAQPGKVATITQNGTLVRRVDLRESTTWTLDDGSGGTNVIEVENGCIRVAEANCPDGICVRQGWISDSSTPIVCLPHGLVIQVEGAGSVDGTTG